MKTRAERFWAKVRKSEGCWEWTRSIASGYGQFWDEDRCIQSHRYSWILHNGPIPDGLWVLHKCDNRKCVRPDHLFLGTRRDNINDAMNKGRMCWGEKNARAKLTNEQVELIRNAPRYKGSCTELAHKYGVHRAHISAILHGRRHTFRDALRKEK